MGLLNLIPPDNKLGQLLMGFQQPLNDLGVGLSRGKTWQKGIREASEYTEDQAPLRAEMAQTQAKAQNDITARNKTAAYLRSQPGGAQFADAIENGMIDGSTAFKSWLDASRGGGNEYQDRFSAGQQFGLDGEALNTFALTGSVPGTNRTNVTFGTTPVWGTDENGRTGYGVTGSDGSFKLVDTGGFQPMGPFDVNAQKAGGTAFGKGTTEASLNLPNTIAQAEQSLANLSGLLPNLDANGNPVAGTNKGFDEQFGSVGPVPQQWLGTLDGTEKAGFQSRIRQVQGEAFLTAIAQLKGLGALSDAEGQTATKAITRISEKLPQGEFIKAVKELQDIVARGVERAKAKAAQAPGPSSGPGAGGGNVTSTGVPWSLE